jgi:hypothetical protein
MHAVPMITHLVARHALPASRQKDILTSVRKLAVALDVHLDDLDLGAVEYTYQDTLQAYFAGLNRPPSAHTVRNTGQNLAQLYRAAHAAGLLASAVPAKTKRPRQRDVLRIARHSSPYRARTCHVLPGRFPRLSDWPADVRNHWDAYRAERSFEVREATLNKDECHLRTYVGYHVFTSTPLETWDQLFEVARLRRFIQWHAARVDAAREQADGHKGPKTRITVTGATMVKLMVTLAHYQQRPEYPALRELRQKLPVPEPLHRKTDPAHTISLRDLEDLGLALLDEARQPYYPRSGTRHYAYPRLARAILCQTGLLIRLWWRVPLRSRSMREMDIALLGVSGPPPRLYRDDHGVWQLRYQGEQLKIATRGGRTNEFHVPFPPDLVAHLEEYLHEFRPCLRNADRDPHLFLSATGRPLTGKVLARRLFITVYSRLGRRLYPHLLRTIWTDTYLLNSGGDIDTAAYMLNDSVSTVLQHYHEIRADQQVIKAYAFNQAVLGKGK